MFSFEEINGGKQIQIGTGFFCSNADGSISTNHRIILKNLSKQNVIKCVKRNLEDLIKLLQISKELRCTIFRLGSNFIPFASHELFNKGWLSEIKSLLKDYLEEIKAFNIRLTMHPGQFVVLSSENQEVTKRSLAELAYHFWLLEELQTDENSVVVIHGGGTYGDKKSSTRRLKNTIKRNPWLKRRIALENDEKNYNIQDILEICKEVEIPAVFDYFHHTINPADFDIENLFETWGSRIPEFHISSKSKSSNPYTHGDFVEIEDFLNFCNLISGFSRAKSIKIDLIFEAKRKEQAISKFFKDIGKVRAFGKIKVQKVQG